MNNLSIIEATGHEEIAENLQSLGVNAAHVTNGTYAYEAGLIVPTTLAGFQYVSDRHADEQDAFIIAVNSDVSMQGIMDAKLTSLNKAAQDMMELSEACGVDMQEQITKVQEAILQTQRERDTLEGQRVRAEKVAGPLAQVMPNRQVVILFYNTETPTPLYDALAEAGDVTLKSLHKWGYGTDPDAPKIEGAHNFGTVLAYPLPNNKKPVCHNITVHEDQSDVVLVHELTKEEGPHSQPYISPASKVLFPVPAALAQHAQASTAGGWQPPKNKI